MTEEFNVGVVGAGYVGLTTGACLAHVGHRVTCVDKDTARVNDARKMVATAACNDVDHRASVFSTVSAISFLGYSERAFMCPSCHTVHVIANTLIARRCP